MSFFATLAAVEPGHTVSRSVQKRQAHIDAQILLKVIENVEPLAALSKTA